MQDAVIPHNLSACVKERGCEIIYFAQIIGLIIIKQALQWYDFHWLGDNGLL